MRALEVADWTLTRVELVSALARRRREEPRAARALLTAVAVPHPKWAERPLACVVPKPDYANSLTPAEILDFLWPQVAKFWQPDDVVMIEAIPKTSVGKFDKKPLREQFRDWQPASRL